MNILQYEKLRYLPSTSSLLKISLGLILLTMFSSVMIYAETTSVDINGNSFDIEYTATGMTVSAVESDVDFVSLIFDVDVTASSGMLDVTFERSFFDSLFEGSDDDFIILVDGDEPTFTEINTNTQSRTLSIEVPSGTEEIEIIGSVFGQPEPVEEIPEPVEEIPEPVEEIPEPVEEIPEPLGVAAFVDPNQDPQTYVDRYNNEPTYKEWFDDNYPEYISIYQAVGLDEPVNETSEIIDDSPKTQCGPGTVLKDGVCTLDERCGPGTLLVDGVCTLTESTPQSADTSVKGLGKELGVGVIAAFIIAGIIGIILALMSKASKSKD